MSGVDTFTREQFEAALPVHRETGKPLWEYGGLDYNERVYHIPVTGTNKRITIRSSVGHDGVSADTGKNSIRLWVSYFYPKADKWVALGKLDAWTTRVPGWQSRMTEKLRRLYQLALDDSNGRRASGVNDGKNKTINGQKPSPSLAPEGAGADVAPASHRTEDGSSTAPHGGTLSEPQSNKPSSVPVFLRQGSPVALPGDDE